MLLGCTCYWVVCSGELCVLLGICVGGFLLWWAMCVVGLCVGLCVLMGCMCCWVLYVVRLLSCVRCWVVCIDWLCVLFVCIRC